MIAVVSQEMSDFAGDAGEESSLAADVDGDAGGADDDPADVAVQCGSGSIRWEEHGAVGGVAASL